MYLSSGVAATSSELGAALIAMFRRPIAMPRAARGEKRTKATADQNRTPNVSRHRGPPDYRICRAKNCEIRMDAFISFIGGCDPGSSGPPGHPCVPPRIE